MERLVSLKLLTCCFTIAANTHVAVELLAAAAAMLYQKHRCGHWREQRLPDLLADGVGHIC